MKKKTPKRISILPEILVILLGILVLVWGASEANYYRYTLERDEQRIEMIKSLQVALEEYYKIKGGYPHHGSAGWVHIGNNPDLNKLFDFKSQSDPCSSGMEIAENGIVDCNGRKVMYFYEGFQCDEMNRCKIYTITLDRETRERQFFNSPDK